ncbi:hypothetical protein Sjap_010842 [Stephania japonica]|uniref:C2H2-type domain-containing protein n=1 Tax=Stephania japonica TaxID=461633 RepID=A0AAP0JB74_9MAGN
MEPNLQSSITIYADRFLYRSKCMNREALMMRQWEKERIREEIMAEEILRRRELELEVRRELAAEREFARRRAEAMSGFPGDGNSGNSPFQRPAMPATPTPAPMLAGLGNGHDGKVVFLAKPTKSPDISGTNAKVYNVGDKKFIVTGAKTKPKVWGCALCKVNASSEQALNVHLQEKQHLENVAKLKSNKSAKKQSSKASRSVRKTYRNTIDKKLMDNPKGKNQWYCSLCQISTTCKQGLNDHFQGKGHKAKEAEQMPDKAICNPTNKSHSMQQPKKTDKQEAKQVVEDVNENLRDFWCQDCNVPCSSEIDLASHQKGKSHRAKEAELMSGKTTCSATKSYTTWQKKTDKQEAKHVTKIVDKALSDFCCQDCNVCCSSEIDLIGHQKGKKHMARLEALNQNLATVDRLGTCDAGEKGEGTEATKREVYTIKKVEEETFNALDPSEALRRKPNESEKSNRSPSLELGEKPKEELGSEDLGKKFIFWCKDCQLVLQCESAVASHLKGKKHIARLQTLSKVVATDPFDTNHNNGTNKTGDDSIERSEKTIGIMDGEVNVVDEAEKGVEVLDFIVKNEPERDATKALGTKTNEAFVTTNSSRFTILEQEEKKEGKPVEALKEKFIFWCEDCQLGLHCESSIDSHLKGKKHMARLRAQKKVVAANATTSSHGISISKMEGGFVGTHNNAIGIADGEANVAGKAEEGVEVMDSTVNIKSVDAIKTLGSKTDEAVKTANISQVPSLEQEEKKEEKLTIEDLKKKFKFWCEDCQIGCHSMVVMDGHLKGKKHMARLRVKKEQCASSSASATTYTKSGCSGKDDSSEEGFEEALDDFDGELQIAFKGGLDADEEEEEVGKVCRRLTLLWSSK